MYRATTLVWPTSTASWPCRGSALDRRSAVCSRRSRLPRRRGSPARDPRCQPRQTSSTSSPTSAASWPCRGSALATATPAVGGCHAAQRLAQLPLEGRHRRTPTAGPVPVEQGSAGSSSRASRQRGKIMRAAPRIRMLALPTRTNHGWRTSPASAACRGAPSANPRAPSQDPFRCTTPSDDRADSRRFQRRDQRVPVHYARCVLQN